MKHLWVVESSGGKKWRPTGDMPTPVTYFTKAHALSVMEYLAIESPGLRWRVAKYVREAK